MTFSASKLGAHSDAGGNVELALQAQQNITQHCYCQRSLMRMGQKRAPWCNMEQTWHAKLPRNTIQPCNALGNRQETQQHVMPGQPSSRSRRIKANATLPPCKRSSILCPAERSSRKWNAARTLARPVHPTVSICVVVDDLSFRRLVTTTVLRTSSSSRVTAFQPSSRRPGVR